MEFGESLRLVGSDSVLGSWDVAQGPALQWSDGDVWTLDLEVPAGQQLSFKVRVGAAARTQGKGL